MNAYSMADRAYGNSQEVRTQRGIEYDAFARVTTVLKSASADPKKDFPAYAKALDDNQRLWTILGLDVADDRNQLPPALRAQILSLAEFTFKHTVEALGGRASADVLVEINTAIMRGLREKGAAK